MSRSRESPFAVSHGKCSHESDALRSCEAVEEGVVPESDGLCVSNPSSPRPILVLVCFSCNCGFTGSIRSNEVSHETISLGSGTILKSGGTCDGRKVCKISVSSSSLLSKSRERESAT